MRSTNPPGEERWCGYDPPGKLLHGCPVGGIESLRRCASALGDSPRTAAHRDIARELAACARSLFARGYSFGTAGNLSARVDDIVLVSPTNSSSSARQTTSPSIDCPAQVVGVALRTFLVRVDEAPHLGHSSRTVVSWHRAGFRLYWTWVSRARQVGGRKRVSKEVAP